MNPLSVNLKFAISEPEFRSVQPPFKPPASKLRIWRAMLFGVIAAGLFIILRTQEAGVTLFSGDGEILTAAAVLLVPGAALSVLLYFLERRNARLARQAYDSRIQWAYQKLHCREERHFQCDAEGFTFSCKCGTITRPWSQLTGLTENSILFVLLIGQQHELLPKSGFDSEAAKTEFRRTCSEIVDRDRSATAPSVTYAPRVEEYRSARLLNFTKAGGWRAFVKVYAGLAAASILIAMVWVSYVPLIGGVVLMALTTWLALRGSPNKRWYVGELSIGFDEQCLYIQDTVSLVRTPWEEYLGYVENRELFLLYRSPKLYRMIPRRAFGPKETEFQALLQRKMARYDYRRPMRLQAELTQG